MRPSLDLLHFLAMGLLRILLKRCKCRTKVVVCLVGHMSHQLIHLLALSCQLLIANFESLVDGLWIVQCLQADISNIRIADSLCDAVALQHHSGNRLSLYMHHYVRDSKVDNKPMSI